MRDSDVAVGAVDLEGERHPAEGGGRGDLDEDGRQLVGDAGVDDPGPVDLREVAVAGADEGRLRCVDGEAQTVWLNIVGMDGSGLEEANGQVGVGHNEGHGHDCRCWALILGLL